MEAFDCRDAGHTHGAPAMVARKALLLGGIGGAGSAASPSASSSLTTTTTTGVSALRRFLQWATRSGFFFLIAAAFMSSLSLVAFKGRGLDLDGGNGNGGGGDGGVDDGELVANGTMTKNAAFRLEVAGLLNHSVPIFLSRKAIKSTRPFSCGGSAVVKFRSYMDIKKVSKLADSLPPSDPMTTPGDPTWRRYRSCAVVGNSGSLLETQFGEAIDKHDAVIRFNAAVTEGFEQFVGIKTTLRILNAPDYKGPDGGEMRVTTVRNADIREWAKHYQQQPKEIQERTFMTDPELLCHAWSWVQQRGEKPSSGLVGTVMALKMCDRVDMYGFQSSNYFAKYSRPHYYDWERPQKGREKVHPFTREVALYGKLAKNGFLNVH